MIMFTGIIETGGKVVSVESAGTNLHFTIESSISDELKIDQSVSHDGVCLTVVGLDAGTHTVTVIDETLKRSNLKHRKPGDVMNLERCVPAGGRLDGHIVQCHVDTVGRVERISDESGSRIFHISHPEGEGFLTVAKGSIAVNGISLTVVDSSPTSFSVAIIPYTDSHTNLGDLKVGDEVNLEFDILGKYVAELLRRRATDTVAGSRD